MATTTNAKAARKAAREATLEAHAELLRRSRLNVESLTAFFSAMSRAETADEWLAEKMAALREQGGRRRDQQRRDAGAALLAMRDRGEQVRDIAKLAGISVQQVRELIRLAELPAAADPTAGGAAEDGAPETAAAAPRPGGAAETAAPARGPGGAAGGVGVEFAPGAGAAP